MRPHLRLAAKLEAIRSGVGLTYALRATYNNADLYAKKLLYMVMDTLFMRK